MALMRRDIARTVLVVAEQPFLWGTVRGSVRPELAGVRRVTSDGLRAAWSRLSPWPWLLVGAAPAVPEDLAELVSDLPVPVLWIGQPYGTLPATLISFESWKDLADHLAALGESGSGAGGVELLPVRGVLGVADCYSRAVAALEGVLAAAHHGLPRFRHLAEVERLIAQSALPCTLSAASGRVRLLSGDAVQSRQRVESS
jgi:hypothetical protein